MPTKLPYPLAALQRGESHDPFAVLGRQSEANGEMLRAFMPSAETVDVEGFGTMRRIPETDIFELSLDDAQAATLPQHYRLSWIEKADGERYSQISPYSFQPLLPDLDLHLFNEGRHHHIYRLLGAHFIEVDGISGCRFAVWAPAVKRASVVGDFNGWNGLRHPMRSRGGSGVWELFIPGLQPGDLYKFEFISRAGRRILKADPYGQAMTLRPDTASRINNPSQFEWQDAEWLSNRATWRWMQQPMSVYEVHPGSWRRTADGGFLNFREFADQLVPYVVELGFTHIELLPVMEHPLDESWGYQVSGYYAPTARYGSPDDLRYLIDRCHMAGIGVIIDWVPGHFPKDDFALARFTGDPVYEHADPRRGEHRDWGTLIFDYGRREVANFLLANAVYWLEEFHADGLRVDAVASMLYLDYSRNEGDWIPNQYGGRENLDAIEFLRHVNAVLHARFPGALTIAEESTAWPMVSRPDWMGGLGFSMKWNMGWMNDTLSYIEHDPVHRRFHHDMLTFSQMYAYTENFVLPFSHDEVVHGKRSLLDKMPNDLWQKFANLRLLFAWMYAHPGKKLLFMGGEIAQWHEWRANEPLDWVLLDHANHRGAQLLVRDLNHLYREQPALYRHDFEQQGFEWIDCHDSERSVLSFIRHGDGQSLVCLFNFTPVPRDEYRVGLPCEGTYRELLNTDANCYGGSNVGNAGRIEATREPWNGRPCSAVVRLPPLAAVLLKLEQ
ncbi:MAG: 1,4-alpha-glucan branching protein GlgB [Chromatiaceae bacterium]|nr:1,4-alpha-glucan branching protein GlgB [Gammaproteobacteria bacterium]MCP5304237.1 1,4-alpha-glucan branching protein GlgB [Chromatiaceae bacterium]MCP5313962.1 1,4-alpha-glucan branching protein GlgB [Chromatiaceae bacterium]